MNNQIRKPDLVAKISSETGIPKVIVRKCVDALFNNIIDLCSHDDSVQICNFGTFKKRTQSRRAFSGFQKGVPEQILPDTSTIHFTPAKSIHKKL